jgi:hypothetical protein
VILESSWIPKGPMAALIVLSEASEPVGLEGAPSVLTLDLETRALASGQLL